MLSRRFRSRIAVAAACAAGLLGPACALAPAASAEPASLTLRYQCVFPLIGPQPLEVRISGDIPREMPVGTQIPPFVIDSVSTVNAASARGLRAVRAVTVEGGAVAFASFVVPEYPDGLPAKVGSVLEKTTLPASGGFEVKARGQAPKLTFVKTGPGRIVVGNLVLQMTPRLADGLESGLGAFESECAQEPGQDNVLAEFEIVAVDTAAPPVPANLRQANVTAGGVDLAWDAVADEPGGSGLAGYVVTADGKPSALLAEPRLEVRGLKDGTAYSFTVAAVDKAGNQSAPSPALRVTTLPGDPETPPSVPQNVRATDVTATSATLTWDASTGPAGVAGYHVDLNGVKGPLVTGTSTELTGLTPNTKYTATVSAVDSFGNTSARSVPVEFGNVVPADTRPPSVPGAPTVKATASDSVTLTWDAANDDGEGASGVAGYVVRTGDRELPVTGTETTVDGLTPATAYRFQVQAVDNAGNKSAYGAEAAVTTKPLPGVAYKIDGSASIKSGRGTVKLTGGFTGAIEDDGSLAGDLRLDPAKGDFKLLGVLPITADLAFEPAGSTTGKLTGGKLTTSTKLTVRAPSLRLFGLEIGGGFTCRTAGNVAAALSGTDFDRATGGRVNGTFTLPALTDCGSLTPLLASLVQGPGNTAAVRLTR